MNIRLLYSFAATAALGFVVAPHAQAQSDADRLPWGALKAGNKDGSIPAYTGGLPDSTRPAGFKPNSGFWADPYADEKPLYVITGKNLDQYADKLSDGTKELLKRFPTYSVTVYPSHRTAAYPDWVIENTVKNAAGRCKTAENGEAVTGCFGGIPFPVPKTGPEAMWNQMLSYKGNSVWTYGQGWYVDAAGNKVMTAESNNRYGSEYYDKSLTAEKFYERGAMYFAQNNVYTAPARNVGEGNLMRKALNPIASPDKSWNYSPGQRRTRLSPDAAYDFPVATSGGAMLYDEIYGFSGKMDRFDFKIVGTREMLLPYNAYRWLAVKPADLLQKSHPNPDAMRWELHRVLVVDATLKSGQRHVVQKRRFYMDEDVAGAGMVDAWDASGKLSRGIWMPFAQAYDKKVPIVGVTWQYEFNTGVYYHQGLPGGYKGLFIDIDKVDDTFYTPDGFARRTQR